MNCILTLPIDYFSTFLRIIFVFSQMNRKNNCCLHGEVKLHQLFLLVGYFILGNT